MPGKFIFPHHQLLLCPLILTRTKFVVCSLVPGAIFLPGAGSSFQKMTYNIYQLILSPILSRDVIKTSTNLQKLLTSRCTSSTGTKPHLFLISNLHYGGKRPRKLNMLYSSYNHIVLQSDIIPSWYLLVISE